MTLPVTPRPEFRREVLLARERDSMPFVLPSDDHHIRWLGSAAVVGVVLLVLGAVAVPVSVTRSAPGVAVPAGGFSQISAPIAGQVELHVADGQRVTTGQILGIVHATPARTGGSASEANSLEDARRLLVGQREASLAAADATIAGLRRELASARDGVRVAEEAVALQDDRAKIASQRAETVEPLVAGHYVTGMDYLALKDQQKAAAMAAVDRRAALREAKLHVSQATAKLEEALRLRDATAADVDGQAKRLSADITRAQLANTREIRAPRDGIVVDLAIDAMSFAENNQLLFSIAGSPHTTSVIAYVPSSLRSDIRRGARAMVMLPSANGNARRIPAVVTGIGASEVRKSAQAWEPTDVGGFFRVTLRLSHMDARGQAALWPGQSVVVDVDLPRRTLLQRLIGAAR